MGEPSASWDAELGLLRIEGPGHTAPVARLPAVHDAVKTVNHACWQFQAGALSRADLLAMLRTLRAMQVTAPGPRCGCLRWFWEEKEPVDTNASFFIGLALQLLHLNGGAALGAEERGLIRIIVGGLDGWFARERAEGHPRYPNKSLGDLACGWLSAEVLGQPVPEELRCTTAAWCHYWRREHWGWGEHLSEVYAMVLLTELSAILLYARQLPEELRAELRVLFDGLLEIEDAFAGGPRVPLIRSYAFSETPQRLAFREIVAGATAGSTMAEIFAPWFRAAGWAKLAPVRQERRAWCEVPCHGGAVARAVIRPKVRVGAVSHYPVMAGVDHATWGLSWQSFPAALWRPAGDWAFWRWTTHEGDRVRGHPALDRRSAYLGNALSADKENPPVPRQTSSLTPRGELTLERTLPVPEGDRWDEVVDAFCLLGSGAELTAEGAVLRLRWADCNATVRWLGRGCPTWEPRNGGGWWSVCYSRPALAGRREIAHRWALVLE